MTINLNRFQDEKFGLGTLILTWAILQIIAAQYFEMRTSVDSDLYIENAINLTQGEIPYGREFFYSSYSLLIAIVVWIVAHTK